MLTFIKDGTNHVTCQNLEMLGAVGAVEVAFSNRSGKFEARSLTPELCSPSVAGLMFQGFKDSSASAKPSNVAKRCVFMTVLSILGETCNTP